MYRLLDIRNNIKTPRVDYKHFASQPIQFTGRYLALMEPNGCKWKQQTYADGQFLRAMTSWGQEGRQQIHYNLASLNYSIFSTSRVKM